MTAAGLCHQHNSSILVEVGLEFASTVWQGQQLHCSSGLAVLYQVHMCSSLSLTTVADQAPLPSHGCVLQCNNSAHKSAAPSHQLWRYSPLNSCSGSITTVSVHYLLVIPDILSSMDYLGQDKVISIIKQGNPYIRLNLPDNDTLSLVGTSHLVSRMGELTCFLSRASSIPSCIWRCNVSCLYWCERTAVCGVRMQPCHIWTAVSAAVLALLAQMTGHKSTTQTHDQISLCIL